MYLRMYVCMHARMDAWMHGCMDAWMDGGMEGWRGGGMDGCMYCFLQCGDPARAFLHPWGGLFHFQRSYLNRTRRRKGLVGQLMGGIMARYLACNVSNWIFLKRPTCDKPLGSHSLRIIWQPTNRGTYCDTQKIRNGSVLALTSFTPHEEITFGLVLAQLIWAPAGMLYSQHTHPRDRKGRWSATHAEQRFASVIP